MYLSERIMRVIHIVHTDKGGLSIMRVYAYEGVVAV